MDKTKIVHLEQGDFTWEDVEGKGRCLVPVPRPKVKINQIYTGRKYRSVIGSVVTICTVYLKSGLSCLVLMDDTTLATGHVSQDVSFNSREEIVEFLNNAPGSNPMAFYKWVDEYSKLKG